jgi:outer membrane protein assembly factor BamC
MTFSQSARWLAAAGAAVSLVGCSWTGDIFTPEKAVYETAQTRAPLEVPPDLSQLPRDERFVVPERPQTVTASGVGQPRAGVAVQPGGPTVVPTGAVAKIERQGNQRWLVVEMPPEKAWPILVEFWPSVGLKVEKADATTGVMETVWAENRANLPQDIIRKTLGRVFDSIYSTGEQDKFRARIERTPGGTSEIYVSHRGMIEVYTTTAKETTAWQPRPSDPELEAEMLQRLLVRFEGQRRPTAVATAGTTGPATAGASAPSAVAASAQMARLVKGSDGRNERLEIDEAFDRSWRRVGLALDRGGFTVEDRDRAKGLYFVRYLDPDFEAKRKADEGFLTKLFGREKPVQAPQFRVALTSASEARTVVQVYDSEGKPEKSAAGDRILNLLNDQLR